ncbi:unnamed protein product [Camellia sinensis]
MFRAIISVLLIGFLGWAFQTTRPPPPNICGSLGGPPITAPRIKLRDGRHLAYQENGVSKEMAKYKLVFIHGFGSGRYDATILTPEIAEELGVYLVTFDKPGYGESDPDPKRTMKSMAFDIEELADQLGLGSKFYVIGYSMGGQAVWSCLKYIPHRTNVKQQGEFESIHRDMMVGFGSWEFDPMDLQKPFLDNEGSVHLWQGDDDGLVPVTLQRYIAGRLSWIQYHEVPGGGHLFLYADGVREAIFKTLLLGEK